MASLVPKTISSNGSDNSEGDSSPWVNLDAASNDPLSPVEGELNERSVDSEPSSLAKNESSEVPEKVCVISGFFLVVFCAISDQ